VKGFRWSCALMLAFSLSDIALAKEKDKGEDGQKVDSGSFAVSMNGRRVGTETFSITQNANGSVIESEFKRRALPARRCRTRNCCLLPAVRSAATNGRNRVPARHSPLSSPTISF